MWLYSGSHSCGKANWFLKSLQVEPTSNQLELRPRTSAFAMRDCTWSAIFNIIRGSDFSMKLMHCSYTLYSRKQDTSGSICKHFTLCRVCSVRCHCILHTVPLKDSTTMLICGRPCHLSSSKQCSATLFSLENSWFIQLCHSSIFISLYFNFILSLVNII